MARNASLALVAVLGCSGKSKPEADPAKVTALAEAMYKNTPGPAAAPECKPEQLTGGAHLTQVTVLKLANQPVEDDAKREDWINPPELDHPAARVLVDGKAEKTERRQAAAELLAAPHYLMFRIEMVDVPLALGFKELKRGAVGVRAIRYDKQGRAVCLRVFTVRNDKEVSEWAMDKTDKVKVEPEVIKALRDDLKDQLIASVAELTGTAEPDAPE